MKETTLTGESKDILNENIETLKELFPEIVSENKIDFDKFKTIFGGEIDDSSERYAFNWPGKTQAIKESQKQSTGTLRPCKEESKNWDNTKNLYIEGDNLEVLKLLQKAYFNKIKAIYIDPPYNTGNDFIYKDNYQDNLGNYLEVTGQTVDGQRLTTNTESDGRYHSNWLNMMYPRLKLARNLLKNDGVIFISIDDNEVENLKKICNEIFGEMNFQSCISWRRRSNQPNDATKMIAKVTEYILVYSKNYEYLKETKAFGKMPLSEKRLSAYTNPDNDPNGDWSTTPWCASKGQGGSSYKITTPTGKVYDEIWLGTEETFRRLCDENRIIFTNNGDGKPRKKVYKKEAQLKGQSAVDFWPSSTFGDNLSATADMKKIFGLNRIFDFSKPVKMLSYIFRLACPYDEGIILDFFSGSASTADSILNFNVENNKKIKYILVQIPETTDDKSEAFKEGYKNICEIGKERIRRAGDKIVQESGTKDLDIGFKVFKLDSSNLNKWDPDYDDLEQTLLVSQDNIKPDRTQEDLIYEIMLKYGIDLTLPIEEYDAGENKIYSIGFGALLICLDNKITKDIADSIIELASEDVSRVVFKDNGFASDADKTNIKETLRTHGIDEFITI